ncbi:glycoside hydrolase family 5 protein [Selenomonas sp.]|uniref:glycoside hydrolase family 5 protein n=1 Tax=Selenomonas sp. TaxID=2053611 RepID=UPI0025E89123|nr:glycoside hydrolase family 5 protein [Selenomonas sp.]MCI6283307.1 glycoside hydrolase family 5 protein [Selenomonas sp.]
MTKRAIRLALAVALMLPVSGIAHAARAADPADCTAVETADAMGIGWNLGNSLDAYHRGGKAEETAWGNPVITKELLDAVKAEGFTTVRIPVTYIGHVGDAPDYTIDDAYLDRVQEVVDYAYDDGLYVVINIHHDGGDDPAGGTWINCAATGAEQAAIQAKFRRMWEQIAARFADYDQHLIFEGMNEIHEHGNWNTPDDYGVMKNVNAYNQLFVDAVRAAGGRNADRILIASGYNTNINITTDPASGWQLPADPVKDHLMVSLHYYDPYDFTINSDTKTGVWAWGEQAVKRGDKALANHTEVNTDASMRKLHDTFVTKGIPVFIGEYGAIDKTKENKRNQGYREHWYRYVTKDIKAAGGIPVVWDNGAPNEDTFTFVNRKTNSVGDKRLLKAVKDGYNDAEKELRQEVKLTQTKPLPPGEVARVARRSGCRR